jgi:hypothetical protein
MTHTSLPVLLDVAVAAEQDQVVELKSQLEVFGPRFDVVHVQAISGFTPLTLGVGAGTQPSAESSPFTARVDPLPLWASSASPVWIRGSGSSCHAVPIST